MKSTDSLFDHVYAVIMAGGSGTRFWPLSRRKHPKQLLKLFGEDTLLERTVDRIRGVIPPGRTYVFTSEVVRREVVRLLPGVPRDQIVAEPAARNTAPTLGLAAHEILTRDPEGIMVALPADHVISKPGSFVRALRRACHFASILGRSVILGVRPTEPHTGYGYVKLGARATGQRDIFEIEQFTEKPPFRTARRYVASRRYLWNGGMFAWRAATLIRNFERFHPKLAQGLKQIADAGGIRARPAFRRLYPSLENISIDYAIMEKISGLYAVAADIGWSDVGSWSVVYGLSQKDRQGNVRPERSLCLDSAGNMIVSERKFVATVGVQDLVIVETEDALLVAARDKSQDVGKAVRELERRGLEELL